MARRNRLAAILALSIALAGCATTQALRQGKDAEFLQEYDRAIVEYTKVLREDPDNKDARQGLERVKVRAALEHFSRGRRLSQAARLEDALIELQIAAELNPDSADIQELLASVRTQLRTRIAVSREGKTELESIVERARLLAPEGFELPAVQTPATLMWNGSARDLYSFLGTVGNISIVFDPEFRDQPINIDLRSQPLDQALATISRTTRNFHRVTAQDTVTIVPDTPAKRQEYEDDVVMTFPLSNADSKEVIDALRIVLDGRRVSGITANNMIAIRDTQERAAAYGRLIAALDKARPEVVIDVEILEVDRFKLREYGLQLASPSDTPIGINGQIAIDGDDLTLRDLRALSQADVFLTNFPALFYRLLKQDTNTRTLANTQLRISDGEAGQARFGEDVPVPVTQFVPIATGGLAQQPTTSFNYRTIGVNIDITPRTHHNDQVTMALKLEISSVSGSGFGGLPTFGTRAISTINRLHDGETNLLAGLIRDEDRRVRSGIPGLSDIPAIGSLFAHNRRQTQETDIVITLTPHIIRVLEVSEADLRAFQLGGRGSDLGFDLLLPIPGSVPPPPDGIEPPPEPFQPAPPQPGQPVDPGPAQPIFPPPPAPPPAPAPPGP